MMHQPQVLSPATEQNGPSVVGSTGDAPPKQVALAMERLGQAARLIADVRLGADRLLEAILATEDPRQSSKSIELIARADASMRKDLQNLRTLGRQLEVSGVLNESLRSRGDSWGLHMPLVCPDGAVVAYAWKRQLAGQAGASAVDRTRLALKAFNDQKKRFFPNLEDDSNNYFSGESRIPKRQCNALGIGDNLDEVRTLAEVLSGFEKETTTVRISTHQRLDWLKKATLLSKGSTSDPSKEQNFQNKHRLGSMGSTSMDQVTILEVSIPFVFRAIVSLHPAGSIYPDSVAFFSPDEGGNYMHARGSSVYRVYKLITEHAEKALQYFLSAKSNSALSNLLHWIGSYQTLFTQACVKCGRLLIMDKSLGLLLPPVYRDYRQCPTTKLASSQSVPSLKDQTLEQILSYHIGCYSDDPDSAFKLLE